MPNLLKIGFIRRFWQKIRKILKFLGYKDSYPNSAYPYFVEAIIEEPIGPAERDTRYEQPLAAILKSQKLGCISGGGSLAAPRNDLDGYEISYTALDIHLANLDDALILTRDTLNKLGISVGSRLEFSSGKQVLQIGDRELVRLYIDNLQAGALTTVEGFESLYSQLADSFRNDTSIELRAPSFCWKSESLIWFTGPDADLILDSIRSQVGKFPVLKNSRVVIRKRATPQQTEEIRL